MNSTAHSPPTATHNDASQTRHLGLFIDSMDPGGAEQVVISLARGMRQRGLQVTLYHFGNPWIKEESDRYDLTQVVLKNRAVYKAKLTLPVFIWQFRRMLRNDKIDVLHSHLLGAMFAGSLAAWLAGIRSIGTLHDTYSLDESRNAVAMVKAALIFGTELVTVAEEMRSTVCQCARVSLNKVSLIYNGVDLKAFAPRAANIERKIVTIICVARMEPIKRIDVLLRALAAVNSSRPWELRLLGNGNLEASLRQLSEELQIEDNVIFAGFQFDIANRLAEADIFVLPSDSEGLSVSIMESMAAGLPAIVTDVGGNRELVLDGESGVIVPAGNIDVLTNALTELIGDVSRRRAMGRKAREIAVEKFSLEIMLDTHLTMYQRL